MPSEAAACEVTILVGGNKEIKHWKYNANGELCLLIFNLYFFFELFNIHRQMEYFNIENSPAEGGNKNCRFCFAISIDCL